jgi:hypothetical protein
VSDFEFYNDDILFTLLLLLSGQISKEGYVSLNVEDENVYNFNYGYLESGYLQG